MATTCVHVLFAVSSVALSAALLACGPGTTTTGKNATSFEPVVAPGGALVHAKDLGLVAETSCGPEALAKVSPGACRRLSGSALNSGGGTPPTTEAFDGDVCTTWKAGGPAPRYVAQDYGMDKLVTAVVLIPAIDTSGPMRHVIEASDDAHTWRSIFIVEDDMQTGHAYEIRVDKPFSARALRVSTTAASGWVAWREVVGLACD